MFYYLTYWFIELCVLIKFIYAQTIAFAVLSLNVLSYVTLRDRSFIPNGKKLKVGGLV